MTTSRFTSQTLITRNPRTASRLHGEALYVVLLPEQSDVECVHILEGTGRRIFELCDGRSFSDLAHALQHEYTGRPDAALERDLLACIQRLADLGLVHVDNTEQMQQPEYHECSNAARGLTWSTPVIATEPFGASTIGALAEMGIMPPVC